MSEELRTFLIGKGVVTSRTTSYNPEGNGQVERYNGIIWKAIVTCLKSKNLPVKYWQDVLADALHSVHSLLCTATNETPHERFFSFSRRSTVGSSIPSWLLQSGPVLIKRQVRSSKHDPLVDEVELLQANPHYAHVRYPDGRETTVAIKQLAPRGQEMTCQPSVARNDNNSSSNAEVTGSPAYDITDQPRDFGRSNGEQGDSTQNEQSSSIENPGSSHSVEEHNADFCLRRSTRTRRPVDRLNL